MVRQRLTEEKAFRVVQRERRNVKREGKRQADAGELKMSARQK